MSDTPADEPQHPYTPQQTAEMLRNFQVAVLAASNELLHLTNILHFIYGAALAGPGSQSLKSTLTGQDKRLMQTFEAVLDVFRQRNIPILEEYTDLLPFILDTVEGVRLVIEESEDGVYLREILRIRGDLSTLLEKLTPVQNLVQRPKKKALRKVGRPRESINHFLGQRANELRLQYGISWAKIFDILIRELNNIERNPLQEQALQKLLDIKLKMSSGRAGDYLRQLAERSQVEQQ
ncbi:MAG: hypothetical protein ABI947_14530 [Chloroflexota bacterium]